MKKICIVGASGKLGRYMVRHALERGYEVVAVCRAASVAKLAGFGDRITIVPGATDDRRVIEQAVAGCDGVLTVLVPWGMQRYASGTAQAVLDFAPAHARLVFSCGWHITRDGKDVYPMSIRAAVAIGGWLLRLLRVGEIDDQVEACRRVFRERRALDCGSRQQPGGRGERRVAGVERARRRCDPREQPHAPDRLCAVHGRGADRRYADPPRTGDLRAPHALRVGGPRGGRTGDVGAARAAGSLGMARRDRCSAPRRRWRATRRAGRAGQPCARRTASNVCASGARRAGRCIRPARQRALPVHDRQVFFHQRLGVAGRRLSTGLPTQSVDKPCDACATPVRKSAP
ncbi:NAD(P)H-binding protein [Burkholderia contaminans]|uniref:NAD(P)H-binding protein n=2 Tax=Burkholderia contaminans TaxID=488447 RepID=UPI001C52E73C|nr:NAD(P)H-binding protein [Burkholderia contaminans]